MDLGDKVAYSTIDIELYQPELVRSQMYPVHIPIKSYQPGFLSEMRDSIFDGWIVVQQLMVFITKFWSVALLLALVFFGYKKLVKKYKPQLTTIK